MLNIQRVSLRMVCALAVTLVPVLALSAKTHAGVVSCPTSITSCGCTINQTGSYTVINELNATQGLTSRGDCIDIKAPNVILDGGGEDVDGDGTGVGIRALPRAVRAVVQNFDEIEDWNIGVKIDSGRTTVTTSTIVDNASEQIFLRFANNANVTFDFLGIEGPGNGPCILVSHSNNDTISNLEILGCTGGIVLNHSKRISIASSLIAYSSADGIFLDPGSNSAKIASNCVGDNENLGIEIGKNSKKNLVAANCVLFDDDGSDILDDNPNCYKNVWSENEYTELGGASPSCATSFSDLPCDEITLPLSEGESCGEFFDDGE